jgi:hypothetical protein
VATGKTISCSLDRQYRQYRPLFRLYFLDVYGCNKTIFIKALSIFFVLLLC